MTLRPFLEFLRDRFRSKIDPEEYYLSYSGGKDSHFLLWFIREYLDEPRILADVYGEIVTEFDEFPIPGVTDHLDLHLTGASRTGCVWCMFGISQDKDRFIRLKEREPKRYDFIMNGGEFVDGMWTPSSKGLGYKFVIDWLNEHGNLNIRY